MRIILFIVAISLIGCSRKIAPTLTTDTKVTEEKSDSTWSDKPKVVERDTTTVKGTELTIKSKIEIDSITHKIKPIHESKKEGNAQVDIDINDKGEMTTKTSCDSLQRIVEKQQELIHQLHKEKKSETKTITKTEIRINHEPYWYDIACRWITCIVLLIIIGFIIYSYIKLKTQFIKP